MEKQISVDERIRRAEERYNRQNGNAKFFEDTKTQVANKKLGKKKGKKAKLFMQIFFCLTIYLMFYVFNNWEYVFSDSFKSDINVFLTEKTNIYQLYCGAKSYIEGKFSNSSDESADDSGENSEESNEAETTEEQASTDEDSNDGVGGAEEDTEADTDVASDDEETQMEIDAKEIKESISFITPLEGTITSTFGWRDIEPKYHTGLDIATSSGTVIKSATDGEVILASSEGDYGNHYQIQIDDVIIIYAHCKTLYLEEGDTVVQGQEIAEVGSTGNSTGPHLHFEIRKDGRKVDPQLVLDI